MERDAATSTLAIGDRAPYFSLSATDGKIYSVASFAQFPVLVVVFTCNHCPYARAYEKRLVTISREFADRGVQFVAICANDPEGFPQDSFEMMIERSKELGFPFPYLHDKEQIAARAYDAACTPEVYVFNAERQLVYHGAVDDNHQDESRVTKAFLRDALEAALKNTMPPEQETSVIGCSIKWRE
ncbi:MAG: thioredoxin family protein [Bdellovibrionales bacterium]|nr:thioredoxin family protein [Bdellovibrionales bacterium]